MSNPFKGRTYRAVYLPKAGVHYDGNERYESGVPRVVDYDTAVRLGQQVTVGTAIGPNNEQIADPRPAFSIQEVAVVEPPVSPVTSGPPVNPVNGIPAPALAPAAPEAPVDPANGVFTSAAVGESSPPIDPAAVRGTATPPPS